MKAVVRGLAAAALAGSALAAPAADLTLKNAWMRPAPVGAEAARAYVDIESRVTVDLVGATTPVARQVLLVHAPDPDDPAREEVVPAIPVLAGTTTRLAYRGDHLRLTGLTADVANGVPVPVTLVFRDADGREIRASTEVVVRGLLLPQHRSPESRGAPPSAAGGVPTAPP